METTLGLLLVYDKETVFFKDIDYVIDKIQHVFCTRVFFDNFNPVSQYVIFIIIYIYVSLLISFFI